ncbi:MaoC/PaaZ C-terminal domain-containing protein [Streptomyces sp. SRF1]|uniref:MaoC/PaaZ C-terminal domain-containing protein n=1 Tax=Streptomyces sp. SRF1 TaxID=1549642 RepID=UPI0025AF21E9|nr:MaoC/PaaZ C-terminal domain-containing protein [Streptomyces sp. SRF1]MDN3058994.1 MaoC/PaaZ C-terminal domain-containing protein [Streptomyces sp. SRF1]
MTAPIPSHDLYFDDLAVGTSWVTTSRTVTEADVGAFAGLTGDRFPLHTSEEFARRTPFGTRVAHGLVGLTFAMGLMWPRTGQFDRSSIAFLGVKDWNFLRPIAFGESIHVEYEVVTHRASRTKKDRGIVEFDVRLLGAGDDVLQRGTLALLLAKRPADAS